MLVSTRTWAALGLIVLLAAACGGAGETPPAAEVSPGDSTQFAESSAELPDLPEGDCEEGDRNPVPAARKLMDAQVPSTGHAFFEGAADVCGVDEFAMEVTSVPKGGGTPEAFFSPSVLIGEPGQELTLWLAWGGGRTHNFSLDAQGIDVMLMPDDLVQVQITFPTDGEPVLFYCKFHDIGGQWGALVTY